MVDFNNPLAGKDIKVSYNILEKVTDIKAQLIVVFEAILRLPENMFKIDVKEKNVTLSIPEQLAVMKDQLLKSVEEYAPEIKNYSVKIETFKKE